MEKWMVKFEKLRRSQRKKRYHQTGIRMLDEHIEKLIDELRAEGVKIDEDNDDPQSHTASS